MANRRHRTCGLSVTPISRTARYGRELRVKIKTRFHKLRTGIYALPDCDEIGKLTIKYVIIEVENRNNLSTYKCSCESDNCLHVNELKVLPEPNCAFNEEIEEYTHTYLEGNLFGVYCKTDNSYSILSCTESMLKCLKCLSNVKHCKHVAFFLDNGGYDYEKVRNTRKATEFTSISTSSIPYHMDDPVDRENFKGYVKNVKSYPTELIPLFNESTKCSDHGNIFDKDKTIVMHEAQLHLPHDSEKVPIHYRPAVGCLCRQHYDGRYQLLLNVDNYHVFPYTWLFDILHNTQSNHYTLYGAVAAVNQTRAVSDMGRLTEHTYKKLRYAYNCFVRRLEFNYSSAYRCEVCGPNPKRVGMDGLCMGGRKDLLPFTTVEELPNVEVKGSTIEQQVFVRKKEVRNQLKQYANLDKGHRYKKNIEPLSDVKYTQLCDSLACNKSLQKVVISAGNPCPESLQRFVGELSMDSPLCGMIQIAGNDLVCDILVDSIVYDEANFQRTILGNKELLVKSCPLLIGFLEAREIYFNEKQVLLKDLINYLAKPFQGGEPAAGCYGPINESAVKLADYPNFPIIRGLANYDANKHNEVNGCRKSAKSTSSLNPGMFLTFCPHGICLGFQVMINKESPRVPFEMLMTRFKEMPTEVIYDNACHLHVYALKREPNRFKNTRFMIDRLHAKNHVSCSLGYDMNEYKADVSIATFNSQICEQANADLRRLSTAFTSMGPENIIQHTKVFLAIRNLKKKAST